MIRALAGNNQADLRRRLEELVTAYKKDNDELSIERFDGEEAEPQAIIDAVASLPFLAPRKLVVVRGLSAGKQAAEALEQIISSTGDSSDLILYEPSADKRSAYYKRLKKLDNFEEFNEQDARNLPKWLADRAKESGGSISAPDAVLLIERVGTDQQLLAGELEKLIIYEPKVTRESIELLTEKAPQSKVFDLLDAAFAGQKERALKFYDEQRAQRIEPQFIMAMLAWQLRLIVLAKLGQGRSADSIARDASVGAYPLTKAQGLASRLTMARVKEMVADAEKLDRLSKTKPIELDEAIRNYIVTL